MILPRYKGAEDEEVELYVDILLKFSLLINYFFEFLLLIFVLFMSLLLLLDFIVGGADSDK